MDNSTASLAAPRINKSDIAYQSMINDFVELYRTLPPRQQQELIQKGQAIVRDEDVSHG
ncbi:MAG: hypothetical protein ACI9CO_000112 [Candidatus Azotimanducaceae bacterium]|jgi:hypothetical protein